MPIAGFLTVQEAATILGIKDSSVRHAIRDGRLTPEAKVGHGWLIREAEVARYKTERQNSGRPFKQPPAP